MKKLLLILPILMFGFVLIACENDNETDTNELDTVEEANAAETDDGEPEIDEDVDEPEVNGATEDGLEDEVEGADDVSVDLGEEFELGDWSIIINSTEITDRIEAGDFMSFVPSDDGNVYFVVELTVTNNGTGAQDFLPMFSTRDDLSVGLFYNEDFRYGPSGLLGHDEDLSTMSRITALGTRTGILAFSVPPVVVESDNSLEVVFSMGSDELIYSVR